MVSILQRASSAIKAWQNPSADNSIKYSGWSLYDTMGGLSSRNNDILYSEQGAAQAYGVMVGVQAAIRFYMDAIGLLTLQLKDSNDEVLWDSTQSTPKDANDFEGAALVIAMDDFHTTYYHDYRSSIVFSDLLYAETYTFTIPNKFNQHTVLEWINPLHITPNIQRGIIQNFQVSGDKGFSNLPPDSIAYRVYNRSPYNDLRGQSRVLTAIDAINIERNAKRAVSGYFANGMILGGVVSPATDDHLAPPEIDKMRNDMRRGNGGVAKAFSWVFTPVKMNIEAFTAQDMDKHYEIVKSTRNEIMMALAVPKELVGDSEGVSYENAKPVMENWLRIQGRAYADSQLHYLNKSLLPKFEADTDVTFSYDFTQIDRRDAALVHADMDKGVITLGDAANERGFEADKDIVAANIRIIGGVPYTKERLLAIANGEVASVMTRPDGTSTTSGGSNDPVELTNIPNEQVFGYHIESGIVDINEARAQIGLLPKAPEESNKLQALQAQFAVMVTANQAGIPPAISAQMVGVVIPELKPAPAPDDDSEPIEAKHIHIGEHPVFINNVKSIHKTDLDELIAWKRVVSKNSKTVFEPIRVRGDLGDTIQLGLDNAKGDIKAIRAVFDDAKKALEDRIKTIQATRLQFEDNFDNLLKRARDEKMTRSSWSASMRKIIRSSGKKAFSDGLIDFGVLDGIPSEEDQDEIVRLIAEQSPHVTALGNVLYKEDGITDDLADIKAAMWYVKSIAPFFDAGRLSANGNQMVEFAGDDGEDSCNTCQRLDGQRHRFKVFARRGLRPGVDTENFDCNGYNCDHKLVPVSARARGRI